jgi:endonuclease YncB( thermonuclease family)
MKRLWQAIPLLVGVGAIAYGVNQEKVTRKIPPNSLHCQLTPGSIYDGDTFRANCNGEQIKIRLCGIDAPEKKQPLGIKSRDTLRRMIRDDVYLTIVDSDRYGRKVAEVFVPVRGKRELFVNAELIKSGMAWHYARYSSNCPNQNTLVSMETLAKERGLGIWGDSASVPPWEWRKR